MSLSTYQLSYEIHIGVGSACAATSFWIARVATAQQASTVQLPGAKLPRPGGACLNRGCAAYPALLIGRQRRQFTAVSGPTPVPFSTDHIHFKTRQQRPNARVVVG